MLHWPCARSISNCWRYAGIAGAKLGGSPRECPQVCCTHTGAPGHSLQMDRRWPWSGCNCAAATLKMKVATCPAAPLNEPARTNSLSRSSLATCNSFVLHGLLAIHTALGLNDCKNALCKCTSDACCIHWQAFATLASDYLSRLSVILADMHAQWSPSKAHYKGSAQGLIAEA